MNGAANITRRSRRLCGISTANLEIPNRPFEKGGEGIIPSDGSVIGYDGLRFEVALTVRYFDDASEEGETSEGVEDDSGSEDLEADEFADDHRSDPESFLDLVDPNLLSDEGVLAVKANDAFKTCLKLFGFSTQLPPEASQIMRYRPGEAPLHGNCIGSKQQLSTIIPSSQAKIAESRR